MGMKHIKLFEAFVSEGTTTSWNGKWKVTTSGKHPGAPEWEILDVKKGFKDGEEAADWARKQKQGKGVAYDVEPEQGWIDPAGTWHPDTDDQDDDDFYDPAMAYESKIDDTLSKIAPTVTYEGTGGEKIEIKEMEGEGMAGEPMTFAYVLCDGKISHSDELKSVMSAEDFKDMSEYISGISDSNEDSAVAWVI
jgi:hypothetical protein